MINKNLPEKLLKDTTNAVHDEMRKLLGNDVALNISLRKKRVKSPDFVMLYQEVGKRILEGNIALSTSKVFFYLIMNIDFENFIGIDQKSISENIEMPLPTVKKALKELKDAGMLICIKDNFDSRRNVYRLNPVIGWKGAPKNRIKMIKENPNQIKLFEDNIGETPTEKHSLLPPSLQKTFISEAEIKK